MSPNKLQKIDVAQGYVKANILVVDDEPMVREAMRSILFTRGHNVVLASDGGEAIRLLQQGRFDIVFTDLTMPGISGWEVAASAKRLFSETPVIVATGWSAGIDDAEVERRGADGIVRKPFDMEELLDLVAKNDGSHPLKHRRPIKSPLEFSHNTGVQTHMRRSRDTQPGRRDPQGPSLGIRQRVGLCRRRRGDRRGLQYLARCRGASRHG